MKKYILAAILALTSITGLAIESHRYLGPPTPIPLAPLSDGASGNWYSQQDLNLKVQLNVGKYYANGGGMTNCGRLVQAVVSLNRVVPVNGLIYATGNAIDSSGVGVPLNTQFNLLTKNNALAGTMKVVGYDSAQNYLTVNIVTPSGGPNGTFVLNRDPLVPYTALIVPNCP